MKEIILKLISISVLKAKVILFTAYMTGFGLMYFLEVNWESGLKVNFTNPDIGMGEYITTGGLLFLLILVDVIAMIKKNNNYVKLIQHPNVPDRIKEMLAKDFLNNK